MYMNIALVNSEYPSPTGKDHGGIATYVYTMANALADAGHCVHVCARNNTLPDKLNDKVIFHTFKYSPVQTPFTFLSRRFNGRIYWEKGCSQSLLECIHAIHEKTPLDAVEIPEYNGLASQFSSPQPFPVIINFHTPTILIDKLNLTPATKQRRRWYTYEKNALKNADAFRCPSKALAARLTGLFSLPQEEISIIRNPIPTTFFDVIRKRQSRPPKRCEILFSGRLERRKGAEIILRIICKILAIDPSIHVTFAGETEMGESASYRLAIERAVGHENRERIWFLGPQDRERLSLLLCRSDIFIMPSLFENAPYTLLEAMAAQLPVIGADTGGISEIIEHNETGLLFSPDTPEELCACIREYITKPDLRNNLAARAYNYVKKTFNPAEIAQQSVAFYSSVKEKKQ